MEFLWLTVCVALLCSVRAQLWISILSNDTEDNLVYSDWSVFSRNYANLPEYTKGFVHQPSPRNACSYVPPVSSGQLWLALVDDYPVCVEDMLVNVRAAGYHMIIASLSEQGIPSSVYSSGYPVVLVDPGFTQELLNTSSPDPQLAVAASIMATGSLLVAVLLLSCLCCCASFTFACFLKRRSSRAQAHAELMDYRDRRARYQAVQQNDRLARQELIESILRQLQDLQVDVRTQVPLGAQATARLPTRPYHCGDTNYDSCAICVEDFIEGESLRWLPCQHSFHPQCIGEWLSNHSSLCPLCKSPVHPSDSPPSSSPSLNLV